MNETAAWPDDWPSAAIALIELGEEQRDEAWQRIRDVYFQIAAPSGDVEALLAWGKSMKARPPLELPLRDAVGVMITDLGIARYKAAERDTLKAMLETADGLLQMWGDALYECGAKDCKAEEKMHLRNFKAARPTLTFLDREGQLGR